MTALRLLALWTARDYRYGMGSPRGHEAMRGAYVWRCGEVDSLPVDEPRRALRDALTAFRLRWYL